MSYSIAQGIVEYHLHKMQEELGDAFWEARISFKDAIDATLDAGDLHACVEDYLYEIKSDYDEKLGA